VSVSIPGEELGGGKNVLTSGSRLAEREGSGSGVGLARGGVGPVAPGCGPSGCWVSPFIFFFQLFFFFCFRSLIWFLKRLSYSDLNKNQADHFWSLESVFTTYKLEV
jgi:hypothetical protein